MPNQLALTRRLGVLFPHAYRRANQGGWCVMKRNLWVAIVPLLALFGCHLFGPTREPLPRDGMPELAPAYVDYIDTDAFDKQFEAYLVAREPAIVVRTDNVRPDWQGRLNAWVAAWNRGGSRARTVRGQAPLSAVKLDGDGIRELRGLVGDLLSRAEQLAVAGGAWYANERERNKRVALLKPYSLRFHRDGNGPIQLIFFHGDYASYYPTFMRSLMKAPEMEDEVWARGVECSHCQKAVGGGVGRLVSRAAR